MRPGAHTHNDEDSQDSETDEDNEYFDEQGNLRPDVLAHLWQSDMEDNDADAQAHDTDPESATVTSGGLTSTLHPIDPLTLVGLPN